MLGSPYRRDQITDIWKNTYNFILLKYWLLADFLIKQSMLWMSHCCNVLNFVFSVQLLLSASVTLLQSVDSFCASHTSWNSSRQKVRLVSWHCLYTGSEVTSFVLINKLTLDTVSEILLFIQPLQIYKWSQTRQFTDSFGGFCCSV